MKRITEYTIARDSNIKDISRIVDDMIEQGLHLFGSPNVTESDQFLACQAMVKYAEDAKS
jgi:hypothetical protein